METEMATNQPKVLAEGKQILLMKATKRQLKAFCADMEIPTQNFDTEDRLRKKILESGWIHPFIVIYPEPGDDEKQPQASQAKAPPLPPAAHDGELVRVEEPIFEIKLMNGEGKAGRRHLFVGVNGVGILIPRNTPCRVKHRYWVALSNAVETHYPWDEEENCIGAAQDVPSYPFETIRAASDEDLLAWRDYKAELQRREVAKKKAKDDARYVRAA
jgi:hypothetical protein